jgi:serine/threonine protein kinase
LCPPPFSFPGVAKLADFGASQFKPGYDGASVACLHTTKADDANTLAGTPYFMSPEAVAQKSCGRRADVWSFGGFVLNMATGRPPWRCLGLRGQFQLFTHVTASAESPVDAEDRTAASLEAGDAAAVLSGDLRAFLAL